MNINVNWIRVSNIGIFLFIENIYTRHIALYWRNDTHNLCQLTVFILKSVRPTACSSFGLFVGACSSYIVVCLFLFVFKLLIP